MKIYLFFLFLFFFKEILTIHLLSQLKLCILNGNVLIHISGNGLAYELTRLLCGEASVDTIAKRGSGVLLCF